MVIALSSLWVRVAEQLLYPVKWLACLERTSGGTVAEIVRSERSLESCLFPDGGNHSQHLEAVQVRE